MKKSKYNNTKTVIDGITFDSIKEAKRYRQLELLVKAKIVSSFTLQPEFHYTVTYEANGKKMTVNRKYIADFIVNYFNRPSEIEDVKGFRTSEYKRKKLIIEKLYGIKIVEK